MIATFTLLGIDCTVLWLLRVPKPRSSKRKVTMNNISFFKEEVLLHPRSQNAAAAVASSIGWSRSKRKVLSWWLCSTRCLWWHWLLVTKMPHLSHRSLTLSCWQFHAYLCYYSVLSLDCYVNPTAVNTRYSGVHLLLARCSCVKCTQHYHQVSYCLVHDLDTTSIFHYMLCIMCRATNHGSTSRSIRRGA